MVEFAQKEENYSDNYGGVSGDKLRQFIDKIEHLENQKADIAEEVREIYKHAKHEGFDPKIVRKVVSLRKKETSEREEEQILLDIYLKALGM